MIRSLSLFVLCGIVAIRAQAQTPPTTTPPSNPPTPTPIPAVVVPTPPVQTTAATTIVVDTFDSVTQWTATPADGVEISVHPSQGYGEPCAWISISTDMGLWRHPPRVQSRAPPTTRSRSPSGAHRPNTLEFSSSTRDGRECLVVQQSKLCFQLTGRPSRAKSGRSPACGQPRQGLKQFAAIELAITAGSGGKGRSGSMISWSLPRARYAPYPFPTSPHPGRRLRSRPCARCRYDDGLAECACA